jgi:hypothetical protein
MNIYHFFSETGIFYAEGWADESPLEPGVFLIPAHATTLRPPTATLPDVAVFKNGKWTIETLPPPPEAEPVLEPVPVFTADPLFPANSPLSDLAQLTPVEKLARSGLTVAELKSLLGLD